MAYAMIASKPGGREVLQKIDIDVPAPKSTDVLIRHTAIGVNFIVYIFALVYILGR